MCTPLDESRNRGSATTFQQLPNEIQLMILKYLSLYDFYNTLFGMNSKFNSLVYSVTPKRLNMRALNDDIRMFESHLKWLFRDFIWWDESVYYLIPQIGWYALRWKIVPRIHAEQWNVSENYRRILSVISKHPMHLNTLFLILNVYDIKKLYFLRNRFPEWVRENYSEQHQLIIESSSRWYTKEVCNAFMEINKVEKERQEQMIHEQAKKIWNELSEAENFLLSDLPVFPKQEHN